MNTDSISRVLGRVLEYKNMGNTLDIENEKDSAVLMFFLDNLEEGLARHKAKKGFIIVEGHSDCGAVKLAHGCSPLSKKMASVLKPISRVVEWVYSIFKEKPESIMDTVEHIVSEAALTAKTDLKKKYYPEIFADDEVVDILRKFINPTRASMALHFYICLANAMSQIWNIMTIYKVRDYVENNKLELLAAFYDIFSAKTYYYIVDYSRVFRDVLIYLSGKPHIVKYFREI